MKNRHTPDWFRSAILYHIYLIITKIVKYDGIGDLPGIIRPIRLYQTTRVTALWLSPSSDSPMKDAGYDVRDFCQVAERYGTLDDSEHLSVLPRTRAYVLL